MNYTNQKIDQLNTHQHKTSGLEIAVIGMAGRFPGARSVDEFWQNLKHSVESITPLNDENLLAQGISPELLADPTYIKVGGVIEDSDLFDAAFFGFSPREAEILDPQQRLFLETAVEALETAGYDAERYPGGIGVYGGAGMNGYLLNLYSDAGVRDRVTPYELFISNDKDFLTTRVSYKLNLKGPSVDVQTACSSSLVAVHMACQSLLSGECDMALAGGVAISKQLGYRVQEGSIYSPDGHCRAFDAEAAGTVSGNGVGIVVLKRLEDALADKDTIDAVIKGSAINNDGALKVSYTAPCVEAQAAVIQAAHAMAEVSPQNISYIEAHGTGTTLGDPIELSALTQAFEIQTLSEGDAASNKSTCAIGSVKTNIGHLDAAAGISGFIKTVLALKHKQIPASLHFQQPNPNIDFHNSPFHVNTALTDWPQSQSPRLAGVSSFGIGGTNAHIVLEEAPDTISAEKYLKPSQALPSQNLQLLVLSAKTPAALDIAAINLADYLSKKLDATDFSLAEVAYTLQVGRTAHSHRRTVICKSPAEAIEQLHNQTTAQKVSEQPSVVFSFSGQGSQHVSMAKGLYESEPTFKEALNQCAEILDTENIQLLDILYPTADTAEIQQTTYAQPALFSIEYALAQLWMSWGIQPSAFIGHSIGEYVAACLAGVLDLKTALKIVTLRGQLMQQMPSGKMLSVVLSAEALAPMLSDGTTLAVKNGPQLCVVSGHEDAIDSLQSRLEDNNIGCQLLHTSHAFHSPMMEPVLSPFVEAVSKVTLNPPAIPFISNVTGTWITADEATNPDYWGRQIRQPVRFSDGIETLLSLNQPLFLEVGPSDTLTKLTRQHIPSEPHTAINSLPHPKSGSPDTAQIFSALGQLWSMGVAVDWAAVHHGCMRRRIPLPTYPFERQRYWVEFKGAATTGTIASAKTESKIELNPDLADWFYSQSWERSLPTLRVTDPTERPRWLVFADDLGIGEHLAQSIEQSGQDVFTVVQGDSFEQAGYRKFGLNPQQPEGFQQLLADLQLREMAPTEIVYLWSMQPSEEQFVNLLILLQTFSRNQGSSKAEPLQITIITENIYDVVGTESIQPTGAEIQGLCQVMGQEYPNIGCRQIDITDAAQAPKPLAQRLWKELQVENPSAVVAYRHRHRWEKTYRATYLPAIANHSAVTSKNIRLRQGGLYVIVGTEGLGDIWDTQLTKHYQANVVRVADTGATAIETAMQQAISNFGTLNGVFVCSPMTNEHSAAPISLLQPSHWEYSRITKKEILENLAIVLQSYNPDFCCVQSSLSSIIGGLGLAAYSGANHFIDTFVAQQNQTAAFPWFSINWDAHTDIKTATKSDTQYNDENTSAQSGWGTALADFALTPTEVWKATERILTQAIPGQIVVSKGDLLARYKKWIHATPHQVPRPQTASSEPAQSGHSYSRPQLTTTYVAPRNDIEENIADIWKDLLGLEKIGVNDSFFDLGGHSLLAIQVISRLRETFPVAVEMRNLLFEAPTVAKIAAVIAEQLPQESELDEMAALLAEVQTLSTEQVQAQLAGGDAS